MRTLPLVALMLWLVAAAPLIGVAGLTGGRAWAQGISGEDAALAGLTISRVDIVGLNRVSRQTVLNTIRTATGNPYDPRTVRLDVDLLYRLGEFRTVDVRAALQPDRTVVVTYTLGEQPLLAGVDVVGNRVISDQEILMGIPVRAGAPADEYLIEESKRRIVELYRNRGHYLSEVTTDARAMQESSILIFQVIEGPRVRVRAIEFEGNDSFPDKRLRAEIKTETAIFLLRSGRLDQKVIANDVAAIDAFYKNRGYLDVRVDRRLELSPDSREVKVVFVISEGRVYTMRQVSTVGATIPSEQIAAWIDIKSGDVYSQDRIRKSLRLIQDGYAELARPDVRVRAVEIRTSEAPEVDLRLEVDEGEKALIGEVMIVGNTLTQDRVIRRQLTGVEPGRPVNPVAIARAEQRLRSTRLFNEPSITIQPPDPDDPRYRDILVRVKERNTGSFNFGVGVGSDTGVAGEFSITQRNFDLFDTPESFEEYIRGRAFRGAGQSFSLRLSPGDEVSTYSISLTEPYLFDVPLSFGVSAFFRQWQYNEYDEDRMNLTLSLTRQLGEFWSIGAVTRFERVKLPAIADFAPTEVFAAEGPDTITALGLRLRRSTVGTIVRPWRGSVFELSVDRVGLMGGDYDFTTATAEFITFITMREDFLGRRSILRLNARVSHIFESDEAPVYEQFYLGGRTFRGFDFRTISPKGIRNDNGELSDEPVGGEWLFFLGAQYEFPIFEELFNGVLFVDSGTVSDDVGFDEYRLSVGFGIRLYIEAFGPAPLAFDFAFPILKERDDERQLFSFSVDIPF